MNLSERQIIFFATGGYLGRAPFAPGTVGTLAGIPLCFVFSLLGTYGGIAAASLAVIAFIIFSVIIAEDAVNILGAKDPGCVVIDEMAGLAVTMLGVAFTPFTVVGAFLIFRFFDIIKPFPVKYLEKKIPGGAGVVMDDIAAGILANLTLKLILTLF